MVRKLMAILLGIWMMGGWMMATAVAQQEPVRQQVADKIFVWRNDVWIDAEYRPAEHPIYRVGLSSPEYQSLLRANDTVWQYQTLGEHILFVYESWAIETVAGAHSGPLVSSDGQPSFIYEHASWTTAPQPIASSGHQPQPPHLIAVSSKTAVGWQPHLPSWQTGLGVVVAFFLLGIGICKGSKA